MSLTLTWLHNSHGTQIEKCIEKWEENSKMKVIYWRMQVNQEKSDYLINK